MRVSFLRIASYGKWLPPCFSLVNDDEGWMANRGKDSTLLVEQLQRNQFRDDALPFVNVPWGIFTPPRLIHTESELRTVLIRDAAPAASLHHTIW